MWVANVPTKKKINKYITQKSMSRNWLIARSLCDAVK